MTAVESKALATKLKKAVDALLKGADVSLWDDAGRQLYGKIIGTSELMVEMSGEVMPEGLAIVVVDFLRWKKQPMDRTFYEQLVERFMEVLDGGSGYVEQP